LVSERIGQFFVEHPTPGPTSRDRLEYTEYGGGDRWVVLLHGQLMPRRMHQPLARALASEGMHVVTLDLLGHGRSDRPADPLVYSARYLPWTVASLRAVTRPVPRGLVPFWAGIWLDTLDQRPASVAALIHGVIVSRLAPPGRERRAIGARALVVGHDRDPLHP